MLQQYFSVNRGQGNRLTAIYDKYQLMIKGMEASISFDDTIVAFSSLTGFMPGLMTRKDLEVIHACVFGSQKGGVNES